MARRTGCNPLLDIDTIHASVVNHGFAAADHLPSIPVEAVDQIHLAGHMQGERLLIDTHDQPVPDKVWALYRAAIALAGPVPTMIERDDTIPALKELCAEMYIARSIAADRGSPPSADLAEAACHTVKRFAQARGGEVEERLQLQRLAALAAVDELDRHRIASELSKQRHQPTIGDR